MILKFLGFLALLCASIGAGFWTMMYAWGLSVQSWGALLIGTLVHLFLLVLMNLAAKEMAKG